MEKFTIWLYVTQNPAQSLSAYCTEHAELLLLPLPLPFFFDSSLLFVLEATASATVAVALRDFFLSIDRADGETGVDDATEGVEESASLLLLASPFSEAAGDCAAEEVALDFKLDATDLVLLMTWVTAITRTWWMY